MAHADEKMGMGELESVAKTMEASSDAEVPAPVGGEARPHITFKTKMAIFVCRAYSKTIDARH